MQYVAFDSHKRYTFASVEDETTGKVFDSRIEHDRGSIRAFLSQCEPGSPVAVETIGNWYWIVDEIEASGMQPRLVHARKAKMMMASTKKTDRLDAHGMNLLQRTGTLPTVWIPDGTLRDIRELYRTRMVLCRQRTQVKNRIHSYLAKYAITIEQTSDIFNRKGRELIEQRLALLPEHTRFSTMQLLDQLDFLDERIQGFEDRAQEVGLHSAEVELLRTIPGIGSILSLVIAYEIGDIGRFASSSHLAAYSGTTPTVHASGGKVRYGHAPQDVNRYLKWAFIEAANCVTLVRRRLRYRHIACLYERVRARKGHSVAVGAVARHLAEAAYWVLARREPYKEPGQKQDAVSSTRG